MKALMTLGFTIASIMLCISCSSSKSKISYEEREKIVQDLITKHIDSDNGNVYKDEDISDDFCDMLALLDFHLLSNREYRIITKKGLSGESFSSHEEAMSDSDEYKNYMSEMMIAIYVSVFEDLISKSSNENKAMIDRSKNKCRSNFNKFTALKDSVDFSISLNSFF
ncbi:MAG TPA: hypothetical protein PK147_05800 [Saprospiraceae bacterium]|nr:hypothetical protein [Ignavibacteria bacterium]HPQ21343.1 hypothetical protein [Saprospiraceae bacterium]